MFGYIQQSKWSEHVFSCNDRYWKFHNEYHQHVQYYTRHSPRFDGLWRPTCSNKRLGFPSLCAWPESNIEKKVSLDHIHNCIQTWHTNNKIHARINSTLKVIRACIFILWSVLEVTQRVPPTCTTHRTSKGFFVGLFASNAAALAARCFGNVGLLNIENKKGENEP